jgi:hypothetical protein
MEKGVTREIILDEIEREEFYCAQWRQDLFVELGSEEIGRQMMELQR